MLYSGRRVSPLVRGLISGGGAADFDFERPKLFFAAFPHCLRNEVVGLTGAFGLLNISAFGGRMVRPSSPIRL